MTDAVFDPDNLYENIEAEVKRAGGRDGKGKLPNDVWETYSSFANTQGGRILLGVTEKNGQFEATGISEPDRVIDELWAQLNNPQKVSLNLLSECSVSRYSLENGRWVIGIEVPCASRKQRPVFIDGNPLTGTYKRQHSGDFRCTEEEVKRMLAEQTEDARDTRIIAGFDLNDVDMESFKAYRNRFAALKPDHAYNTADNFEFMHKIGGWRKDRLTGEEGLTLAGLLMFGQYEVIHEALSHYFVDYRELPYSGSKTEWVDRLTPDGTWSGNLYDFYRLVTQRLSRDLKVPFRLEGSEREDDTPVHKALREALVNAIIHADYSASISVLVVKAPDYFGFRNPGRMRIPIDVAFEGGNSDCRNRSLQRMFSLIGLGEQAGSGIPRLVNHWQTQHYRLPELWETLEPEATLMRLRTVSLLPEETLIELRDRFGAAFDGLVENERLAVVTAQIEGFVTNERLQQICRLHPRDITVLLKNLELDGFLVHEGLGRGSSYRIAGTEAVDLAGMSDLTDPAKRSAHLQDSSEHIEVSSEHIAATSAHMGQTDPTEDDGLRLIAEPVRTNSRAAPELTRQTIQKLCADRFLTLNQVAKILDRSPDGIRQRFIKPMIDEGLLERRFPQQPNHEQQAYRTKQDQV